MRGVLEERRERGLRVQGREEREGIAREGGSGREAMGEEREEASRKRRDGGDVHGGEWAEREGVSWKRRDGGDVCVEEREGSVVGRRCGSWGDVVGREKRFGRREKECLEQRSGEQGRANFLRKKWGDEVYA